MFMPRRTQRLKDTMHLLAYDGDGALFYEQVLSLHEYYESAHPVIDDDDFRKVKGIVRLVGIKYDNTGKVEEQWENTYNLNGAYLGGTVRDANGAIISKD